jgi:hypothetical protein
MRFALAIVILVLISLPTRALAAPEGQTAAPAPQQVGALFIQGDLVDGTCVMQSRYAPGERIVFRVRVIDAQTAEMARDAAVTVRLDNGTVLPMHFSAHPARPPQTDEFWATVWTVPEDTPAGIVRFTIDAVDGPRTGSFQPFNVESSLLTIVAAP